LAIDQNRSVFQTFASLAREQEMNIAVTYLQAHQPRPRNTVSILNRHGEVVLNYSKVFICDFGKDEVEKPNPRTDDIGCDVNCSPGESKEGKSVVGSPKFSSGLTILSAAPPFRTTTEILSISTILTNFLEASVVAPIQKLAFALKS
jgi:hypothetical protein